MAKKIENLTNAEILAIAKLISDDSKLAENAREDVREGASYHLDFVVHVEGTMNIGKNNMCPCQFRIPILQVVHKMAEKLNGVTVESVLKEVCEDIKAKKQIDLEPLQRAIKAEEGMMKATTELRKGKVTLDVVAKGTHSASDKTTSEEAKETEGAKS